MHFGPTTSRRLKSLGLITVLAQSGLSDTASANSDRLPPAAGFVRTPYSQLVTPLSFRSKNLLGNNYCNSDSKILALQAKPLVMAEVESFKDRENKPGPFKYIFGLSAAALLVVLINNIRKSYSASETPAVKQQDRSYVFLEGEHFQCKTSFSNVPYSRMIETFCDIVAKSELISTVSIPRIVTKYEGCPWFFDTMVQIMPPYHYIDNQGLRDLLKLVLRWKNPDNCQYLLEQTKDIKPQEVQQGIWSVIARTKSETDFRSFLSEAENTCREVLQIRPDLQVTGKNYSIISMILRSSKDPIHDINLVPDEDDLWSKKEVEVTAKNLLQLYQAGHPYIYNPEFFHGSYTHTARWETEERGKLSKMQDYPDYAAQDRMLSQLSELYEDNRNCFSDIFDRFIENRLPAASLPDIVEAAHRSRNLVELNPYLISLSRFPAEKVLAGTLILTDLLHEDPDSIKDLLKSFLVGDLSVVESGLVARRLQSYPEKPLARVQKDFRNKEFPDSRLSS